MAILSAFTIIQSLSLFHLTAAYFLLTAPKMLADQNIVFVLGEAMQIPHATTIDAPTQSTAFAGAILALLAISDLTAASMTEGAALHYWLSNVPIRLMFFFGLTGYAWLFNVNGTFGSKGSSEGIGAPLQNSLAFSFGFFEIAVWFWVFTSLRELRRENARQRIAQAAADQDRL